MKRRPGLSGCVAVGLLVACSGTENRLGGGTGNVAAPGGSSPAAPRDAGPAGNGVATATSLPSGFGAPDAPHDFSAGKWQGYIENYATANRSDSVLLELDSLSETSATGKLVFGDATAPVPDYSDPHRYIHGFDDSVTGDQPAESYPFTLVLAKLTGSRLQFQVLSDEVWQPWCVQQEPIPDSINKGNYNCVPNTNQGFSSDGSRCYLGPLGSSKTFDCALLSLCGMGPCLCDATSCSVGRFGVASFDVSLSGDRMDGSMGTYNVHLTKL